MLFDGIRLVDGAELSYMTVPIGPALPGPGAAGDLFYVDTAGPDAIGLYLFDGTNWQITTYPYTPVNRAGDSMTGYLILHANPTDPAHAATKQYVDTHPVDETQVSRTIATLARLGSNESVTGTWSFSNVVSVATPTANGHAATKLYVDTAVGAVTTNLTYTAATRLLESSSGSDVTLPLFTSTDAGLTPLSGGGTANFLRADGTWASPGGSTDLSYTASTRVLASSTGADATLPLFTDTEAGLTPLSGGGTSNYLRADGTWATPPAPATDLTYTAATRLLESSTGADVTLPLVSSADAGLAPSSGGGTTNFLRADGTWASPPGGAPGGSDGAMQYNDGGSYGGAAQVAYDDVGNILNVGVTANGTIRPALPGTNTNGYNLTVSSGIGNGNAQGGNLSVTAGAQGAGTFKAGDVTVQGGNSVFANSLGGDLYLYGGNVSSAFVAGGVTLRGGTSSSGGNGGTVTISGGTCSHVGGTGGAMIIEGGTSANTGGQVIIRGGWSQGNPGSSVTLSGGLGSTGTESDRGYVQSSDLHIFKTSNTTRASIRIGHGTAPSSPQNGDVWTTTAGMYVRVNGSTVGPLAAATSTPPAGANTQIQFNNAGAFGADDDFTWNSATRTLALGTVGGLATISIPNNLTFNGDSLFIDSAQSRVGIGTSTPEATLSIISQGTGNTRGVLLQHVDNTTAFSHAKFIGRRSRGSHGSPTAVLANDSLVGYIAQGYKATGWSSTVGGLYIYAAENWTDTATGTYVTIRGPAPGGTTVTERARFEHLKTTFTGGIVTAASTTALASINAPHGTAPTAPVDGDIWTTTAGIYVRVNGSTVGPLSAGGTPAGSDTYIQFNNAGAFGGDADFSWNNTTKAMYAAGTITAQPVGAGVAIDALATADNQVAIRAINTTGNITIGTFTSGDSYVLTQGALQLWAGSVNRGNISANGALSLTANSGTHTLDGAKTVLAESVAGYASLRLPHGTAPSAPTDGDVWTTTVGLYARINGATVGPFGATPAITANYVPVGTGTSIVTSGLYLDDVFGELTWTPAANIGPSAVTLNASSSSQSGVAGGDLQLYAGSGNGATGPGGAVFVNAGNSTSGGVAGQVQIYAGAGSSAAAGGILDFQAGNGGATAGTGGAATLAGGTGGSAGGTGGVATLRGGQGGGTGDGGAANVEGGLVNSGAGGPVNITGGAGAGSNKNGGSVAVAAGAATGTGNGGTITISTGVSPTGTAGSLIFKTGTTASTTRLTINPAGVSTFTNTVVVQDAGTSGYVEAKSGDASFPGYIDFRTADNTRRGYIGYGSGTKLQLVAANSWTWNLDAATTIGDIDIGYRSIPRSTTTTTAVVGDRGKCIAASAGITIPNATFAAGDSFSIYNDSASSITITQGASLTLREAGTTNTGNRTLAPRGMATLWFNSSSEAIIMGPGVT